MSCVTLSYRDIIKLKFPEKQPIAYYDDTYDGIAWNELDPTPNPSQATLDWWIAALSTTSTEITRYAFRCLFTIQERIAIDNAPNNSEIPSQLRAVIVTILKDIDSATTVDLANPAVAAGLNVLAQAGLITPERVTQVLGNMAPT